MNYKNLGSSGIKISALGLGCMGMTHAYGAPSDEAEMICLIHSAMDMGITFFDTAECYIAEVNGQTVYNEELVGKALKPYRNKVVIATKFGVWHNADSSLSMDSRPETIKKSVEGSLKRLNTADEEHIRQVSVDTALSIDERISMIKECMRS